MNLKRVLVFSFFIFSCVLTSFWLSSCDKPFKSNEILIGEFSSLTGTTATFGKSTHNGILLAVEEINNAGGILNKKIRLITEDTQSKPEEAASAVTKLINRDKVKAILGEVASSRSLAAAPISQSSKIPMVSPASTNPEVTRKGDYIFRVCFIDPFQGKVMAKFAYHTLGIKKVAILKDIKNDYSIGLSEFFKKTFLELGGEIVGEQAYSEIDTDFRAQLTALKNLSPEAIFVPGYYTEVALLVKQARELNMSMPFLGGDGWDSSRLVEIGGSAMNNSYFSTHYSAENTDPIVQNFVSRYKTRYQEVPDALAALGYDAAKILFAAIQRAGSDAPEKIKDALSQTQNFEGVTGKISMDSERNANKSAVILEIKEQKFHYKTIVTP